MLNLSALVVAVCVGFDLYTGFALDVKQQVQVTIPYHENSC